MFLQTVFHCSLFVLISHVYGVQSGLCNGKHINIVGSESLVDRYLIYLYQRDAYYEFIHGDFLYYNGPFTPLPYGLKEMKKTTKILPTRNITYVCEVNTDISCKSADRSHSITFNNTAITKDIVGFAPFNEKDIFNETLNMYESLAYTKSEIYGVIVKGDHLDLEKLPRKQKISSENWDHIITFGINYFMFTDENHCEIESILEDICYNYDIPLIDCPTIDESENITNDNSSDTIHKRRTMYLSIVIITLLLVLVIIVFCIINCGNENSIEVLVDGVHNNNKQAAPKMANDMLMAVPSVPIHDDPHDYKSKTVGGKLKSKKRSGGAVKSNSKRVSKSAPKSILKEKSKSFNKIPTKSSLNLERYKSGNTFVTAVKQTEKPV